MSTTAKKPPKVPSAMDEFKLARAMKINGGISSSQPFTRVGLRQSSGGPVERGFCSRSVIPPSGEESKVLSPSAGNSGHVFPALRSNFGSDARFGNQTSAFGRH